MPVPPSRRVIYTILLGIAGMTGYYRYLLSDLKTIGPKTEYWRVLDDNKRIDSSKMTVVNILRVDYLPLAKTVEDSLKKQLEKDKTHPVTVPKAHNMHYDALFFSYNSAFLIWIALGAIMMGFAMAFIPVLYTHIKQVMKTFKLTTRDVLAVSLVTPIIGAALFTTPISDYLSGTVPLAKQLQILVKHPCRLDGFILIGIATGLIAFAGQLFINMAVDTLPDQIIGLDAIEQKALGTRFLLLRNKLRFFLLIDSILIVFSVLTTDAFRRAINSAVKINMDIIPQNSIYLYGLMFTFFLSIVYLPVYSRLKEKGQQLIDTIPQDRLDGDMKAIAGTLSIQQSALDSLQVALSILSPVIAALVPGLLKI